MSLRLFLPLLRPERRGLVAGLAASGAVAVLQWAAPWPLKFVFDSVLARRPLPTWLRFLPPHGVPLLQLLAAAMLGIAIVLAGADYLSNRLVANVGQRVVFALRGRLFRHLERQGLDFHRRRPTGDLMARLGGDIQAIQGALVTAVPTLTRNVLTLLGMVAIMLMLDWRYALLALSLAPVLYLGSRHYLRRIRQVQRTARRADGEASAVAQEVLTAIAAVQAAGTEPAEAARYTETTRRALTANCRAVVLQSEFTPLVTASMTVSTVLVLFFGAQAVVQGQLTPGDLLVFMAYLRGMYSPMRQLAKLAQVVGRAQAAADRVAEVLAIDEAVPEVPQPRGLSRARGLIELRQVAYSYPGGPPVLDGVDLELPPGSHTALVGATGCGKSTLLRLIPRFADPTRGQVRLDGHDLRWLSLTDLRRQVALVSQEPALFRCTVWENIVYGTDRGDRATAIAVARAAGVEEVILQLERGFDTPVAERGQTLSGGQRQSIAVARAMARNTPVVLLDEPTPGMDGRLEAVLLEALSRLAAGRTTVTVSHQVPGWRRADRIVVLSRGRVDTAAAVPDRRPAAALGPLRWQPNGVGERA